MILFKLKYGFIEFDDLAEFLNKTKLKKATKNNKILLSLFQKYHKVLKNVINIQNEQINDLCLNENKMSKLNSENLASYSEKMTIYHKNRADFGNSAEDSENFGNFIVSLEKFFAAKNAKDLPILKLLSFVNDSNFECTFLKFLIIKNLLLNAQILKHHKNLINHFLQEWKIKKESSIGLSLLLDNFNVLGNFLNNETIFDNTSCNSNSLIVKLTKLESENFSNDQIFEKLNIGKNDKKYIFEFYELLLSKIRFIRLLKTNEIDKIGVLCQNILDSLCEKLDLNAFLEYILKFSFVNSDFFYQKLIADERAIDFLNKHTMKDESLLRLAYLSERNEENRKNEREGK